MKFWDIGLARRILKEAEPYRGRLAWLVLLAVGGASVDATVPLVYRALIDNAILKRNAVMAVGLAAVLGAVGIAVALFSLVRQWTSARIGADVVSDLRMRLFTHIQSMPLAFFARSPTGALMSRLSNDVLGAQRAFTDNLSAAAANILTVCATMAVMFVLSWRIAVMAVFWLPVFVLSSRWTGRRLSAATTEYYRMISEMNAGFADELSVAGAALIKLHNRESERASRTQYEVSRLGRISVSQALYARLLVTALLITGALATAAIYGWGGVLAARGSLALGTLVALSASAARLYDPFNALSNAQMDVVSAFVSFGRIFELLDFRPSSIMEKAGAVAITRGGGSVEFENVSFRYPSADEVTLNSLSNVELHDDRGRHLVLNNITFRAEPGEVVAVVGPSGSGKTTIVNLIARLYDASDGVIRVNNVDVRDATVSSLRSIVGVVTQDAFLLHDTVRANLQIANCRATDADMLAALEVANIRTQIESLPDGLDTVVGDHGCRFSGGERQRLSIARLVLRNPEVVVLDEATAHLDSASEAAVQQALDAALVGRTAIVVAHRLSTITRADQILVICDGQIVERGTHRELLTAGGTYATLYRQQILSGQLDDSLQALPSEAVAGHGAIPVSLR